MADMQCSGTRYTVAMHKGHMMCQEVMERLQWQFRYGLMRAGISGVSHGVSWLFVQCSRDACTNLGSCVQSVAYVFCQQLLTVRPGFTPLKLWNAALKLALLLASSSLHLQQGDSENCTARSTVLSVTIVVENTY